MFLYFSSWPVWPGTLPGSDAALAAANETNAAVACGIAARMLRYPDVSATRIAFVYAGDIWVAPKSGGSAERLSEQENAGKLNQWCRNNDTANPILMDSDYEHFGQRRRPSADVHRNRAARCVGGGAARSHCRVSMRSTAWG